MAIDGLPTLATDAAATTLLRGVEKRLLRGLALGLVLALLMVGLCLPLAWWLGAGDPGPTAAVAILLALLAFAGLGLTARFWLRRGVLSPLASTLENVLDGRGRGLNDDRAELEALHDSMVEVMRAVGEIASRKDLTVRVPVSDDVTGAVSEALNLLTQELQRLLTAVRVVSDEVEQSSRAMAEQAQRVRQTAACQHAEVELAAGELSGAAGAFEAIARSARACEDAVRTAVEAGAQAFARVQTSASAVEQSRVTVHATEKRLKRLGERSQEIGEAIGLLEGIARRTGILAINASMQASLAGDAGRGFGVIADEIKRLSSSAGEAASRIGDLVIATRAETSQAVGAMSQVIGQVVEVSRLSQAAGTGMLEAQTQMAGLVQAVQVIARESGDQASISERMQQRARSLEEASRQTARQLEAQVEQMQDLARSARQLRLETGEFRIADEGEPRGTEAP